jgi:hypothetical protein
LLGQLEILVDAAFSFTHYRASGPPGQMLGCGRQVITPFLG